MGAGPSVSGRENAGGLHHQHHGAFGGAGAMHHSFRYDESLTGRKFHRPLFEDGEEFAFHDIEELVVIIVFVPVVL
jgi:hypothetical protein